MSWNTSIHLNAMLKLLLERNATDDVKAIKFELVKKKHQMGINQFHVI
jgi:hypothetical protein